MKNKIQTISELLEIKDRGESSESIEVWQCVDLVERLIILSDAPNLYFRVKKLFENPLKQLPEYLLLCIGCAKPPIGNIMIDELLSILMPLFLGNHANSSIVLQKLFEFNSSLFIRGICELCKHDQRLMNLSRVLDIT
jgi:CCR4-NOT transcription complex subunit 1